MTNAKNRKLCWNCDGSVHIHATKCPYCGTELVAEETPPTYNTTYQQPEPLPQPPPQPQQVSQEPPPPPYVQRVQPQNYSLPQQSSWQEQIPQEEPKPEPAPRTSGGGAGPLLMLLPGAFFFLFAMLLLLFSDDGLLTLSWKAKYWFVYLLIACPMLYIGWRSLNRVPDTA